MSRDRSYDRRDAEVVTFTQEGRLPRARFGRFAEGRHAEIFLDAPKENPLAGAAREAIFLVNLPLQHGCGVETIRHALDGRDGGIGINREYASWRVTLVARRR
jgi:hypothetical protein